MSLPQLQLNPQADRRLRQGHLWVFSNEVNTKATPLTAFKAGDQAALMTSQGKPLGVVALSPQNLICARLISRQLDQPLSKSLLVHRLKVALSLRERFYDQPFYRAFFADSDAMSGLVVDRFGDHLAVQITSPMLDRDRDMVVEALKQVFKPKGMVIRFDSPARLDEKLTMESALVIGDVPDWVPLSENGVKFEAPLVQGQKTGWFYDHRDNRARLMPLTRGLRVLDLFGYLGGWGIQAACLGAAQVICVDSSALACEGVKRNAVLNAVQDKVSAIQGDVLEVLRDLKEQGEKFDVVIIDPPAFIKKRKDQRSGEQGYYRLNEWALRVMGRDALLISASCSMHLQAETLVGLINSAARHVDRSPQLFYRGFQAPDHPVHPAIEETAYLKCLGLRVLSATF